MVEEYLYGIFSLYDKNYDRLRRYVIAVRPFIQRRTRILTYCRPLKGNGGALAETPAKLSAIANRPPLFLGPTCTIEYLDRDRDPCRNRRKLGRRRWPVVVINQCEFVQVLLSRERTPARYGTRNTRMRIRMTGLRTLVPIKN